MLYMAKQETWKSHLFTETLDVSLPKYTKLVEITTRLMNHPSLADDRLLATNSFSSYLRVVRRLFVYISRSLRL